RGPARTGALHRRTATMEGVLSLGAWTIRTTASATSPKVVLDRQHGYRKSREHDNRTHILVLQPVMQVESQYDRPTHSSVSRIRTTSGTFGRISPSTSRLTVCQLYEFSSMKVRMLVVADFLPS